MRTLSILFTIIFLSLISVSPSMAEIMGTATQPLRPLDSLLNPAGPLNVKPDLRGSLDTRGWQMMTDANGQPQLLRSSKISENATSLSPNSVPDDIHWDSRFVGPPGVAGIYANVFAIAVSGAGDVYIGGGFTTAGRTPVNNIAKWDGSSWSALGSGLDGAVNAIAISGTDVYVGGSFTMAGGNPAGYVAKWDGNSWSALGSGVDNNVSALAVSGTDVFVGGYFMTAGGSPANGVAKWDGSSWSALGNGVSGACCPTAGVFAIVVNGSDVYAGGHFSTAGVISATNIAKWDGSNWSALGSGVYGSFESVRAIAVSGSDVYVGGDFSSAGVISATNVAKWNGSSWAALGSGIGTTTCYTCVSAISVSGSDLYVGGRFTSAGGNPSNSIAKWNGSSWSALGSGVADGNINSYIAGVQSLAGIGSDIYAGGDFLIAGSVAAGHIARWNGSSWLALGDVMNNSVTSDYVTAIAANGNDVYVSGSFAMAGTVRANGIARWNGSTWSALGNGVSGSYPRVAAISLSGTNTYVGGFFSSAGVVSATNIAKWNGSTWSALGKGVSGGYGICSSSTVPEPSISSPTYLILNGGVSALTVVGSNLYAGGVFSSAGTISATNIAKWNGSTWSALGSGVGGSCRAVTSLTVSATNVYVGGYFTTAGGNPANHIAKWNGSTWSALGSGVSGGGSLPSVQAIAVSGSDVYVGGVFTSAGVVSATNIAKWNGSSWSALGTGVNGVVEAIAVSGNDVYVGGYFTTAGGNPVNYIAKWDGSSWSGLGSGTNSGTIFALAVSGNDVYTGGWFTTAGAKPSYKFGRWFQTIKSYLPIILTP